MAMLLQLPRDFLTQEWLKGYDCKTQTGTFRALSTRNILFLAPFN